MNETIKVAIIGCGGIASGKHLPSLQKMEQVELVAFCDIVIDRAGKAAEQYGAPGAQVFEDYRELLKQPGIEVVHVCTANDSHAEITIAALEASKHVMCEKPMAKKASDAVLMLEAAK